MLTLEIIKKIDRNNIECYTLKYMIDILIPYLKNKQQDNPNLTIWCPCDKEESNYVKVLKENDIKVIYSHIDDGKDCLTYEPEEHWDILITNPPFKGKAKFLKRFMSFNKPIAILLPLHFLNDNGIPNLFLENNKEIQLLIPKERCVFYQANTGVKGKGNPPFKSGYLCVDFLDKQIEFTRLNKERAIY